MQPISIIRAEKLEKIYPATDGNKAVKAVRGINFDVPQNLCVGLLGPNGAGKTTTMRMIMGLSTISSGNLSLFDVPVREMGKTEKARIGLVPQEDNLDPDLTVHQNLSLYGLYYGLGKSEITTRVPQLLTFMKLEEKATSKVQHLSGGMKRRLVIARALIANPELIILDEPTTGLDPQARVMIWQKLLELKKQGKTLLLTTHYMDEAQRLCDKIIVIDGGKILDEGTPQELINRHVPSHVFDVNKPVPAKLTELEAETEDIGQSVLFFTNAPAKFKNSIPANTQYLHRPANLEDVFLRLTGRTLRE